MSLSFIHSNERREERKKRKKGKEKNHPNIKVKISTPTSYITKKKKKKRRKRRKRSKDKGDYNNYYDFHSFISYFPLWRSNFGSFSYSLLPPLHSTPPLVAGLWSLVF